MHFTSSIKYLKYELLSISALFPSFKIIIKFYLSLIESQFRIRPIFANFILLFLIFYCLVAN